MRNKAILKTLNPEPVADIMNGKQTVIVCKNFPKNYVGWVYVCCAKGKPKLTKIPELELANGKVVCRFWCDKVEEIKLEPVEDYSSNTYEYMTKTMEEDDLLEKSCLHTLELSKYLHGKKGYAIHISKLEVFDEPRELGEFEKYNHLYCDFAFNLIQPVFLTKAPSNYCYIESE